MFTIGIDVGGTTTRAAAVDAHGRILSSRRAPTPGGRAELLAWIVRAVQNLEHEFPGETAVGVGLALPGLVDSEQGRLIRSVNLPFLEGFSIGEELAGAAGRAFMLMTDADAATWGEYGACTPRPKAFVHLRLGTGVACGIVVDDKLQSTGLSRRTHWDGLVVDDGPNATPCPCGLRGCLETIASGPAIEQQSAGLGCNGGLAGLQDAWERKEPTARTIIDEVARAIASAIGNLKSQISNDAVVCLGGGVVRALPCLVEQTVDRLRSPGESAPDFATDIDMIAAKLGDDAGVIGAAMLARV